MIAIDDFQKISNWALVSTSHFDGHKVKKLSVFLEMKDGKFYNLFIKYDGLPARKLDLIEWKFDKGAFYVKLNKGVV
jgi:hypothetical protein